YRIIFEADPLPDDVLKAGTGGSNKYENLYDMPGLEMLAHTHLKFDSLNAKLKVLGQSYEEIFQLAKNKEKFLASVPAIQPLRGNARSQIASGYGMRIHPIYKTAKMHTGMDFHAPKGAPVYATGDGVVVAVNRDGGYGLHVIISHGFGYQTLYGHLSFASVKKGQKLKRGEIIGKVGSTGLSVSPHLHYEIIKNGKKINPIDYFHNDLKPGEFDQLVRQASQAKQSFD
ncbi:MAG: M23 family metallopeptidase, partial [Bacteroidota bacterium]|nr:M23 family metallopeptidase [Bacteroidota bacterium]